MNAKDFGLDYFQIYGLENPVNLTLRRLSLRTALLRGQFDEEPEKQVLERLTLFADRVEKNEEGLYDENAHLTNYALRRSTASTPVRRWVWISNQFGEKQELLLREVLSLLVPAQKKIRPRGTWSPRTKLDHYLVYRVIEGKPVETPYIGLKDQFGVREARVHYPIAFAVPVWKKHEKEYGILNDRAHLTIYTLGTSRDPSFVIDTLDQFFGHRLLRLGPARYLAAPSEKLDWKEE